MKEGTLAEAFPVTSESTLFPTEFKLKGDIVSISENFNKGGTTGLFEVLANHAPMVAALGQGTGRIINTDGKKMAFTIEGGFVEVLKNEVSLLVRGYQAK